MSTTPGDVLRAAQMEQTSITNVAALRVAEIIGETPAFWAGWRNGQWVIPTCRNVPLAGCVDRLALDNAVPRSDLDPSRAANMMGFTGDEPETPTTPGQDFAVPGLTPAPNTPLSLIHISEPTRPY